MSFAKNQWTGLVERLMQLKVVISRSIFTFFQRRVLVSAFCNKTNRNVSEPQIGCGECHDLPFKFEVKE
jgi:hypothetical protein